MFSDLSILSVTSQIAPPPRRTAPMVRVRLADGAPIGQSHPTSSLTPSIALAQATAIMRANRCLVSLPARGDLQRWPAVAGSAIAHAGLEPGSLELSFVADQVASGSASVMQALASLRKLGVQLALRGIRPAGSELLRRLPIDTIILAPSSLAALPGANAFVALHRCVGQANELGLQTVATGVETEQQRALLSGLGCQFGEGALFGNA